MAMISARARARRRRDEAVGLEIRRQSLVERMAEGDEQEAERLGRMTYVDLILEKNTRGPQRILPTDAERHSDGSTA